MESKAFINLIFIPKIEYKTIPGEILKINRTSNKESPLPNPIGLFWQSSNIWTNAWTIPLKVSLTFEYQYIVSDFESQKVNHLDIVRKIDLKDFKIDYTNFNTVCILAINDFWGSEEKSLISFEQIPLNQKKCCVVLGKNLKPNGAPNLELKARMIKLAKIIKTTPNIYDMVILTGGKVKQTVKYEADAMYDLGLKFGVDGRVMVKEWEAKNTIENAVFVKILTAKMGFVNFDVITSGYHLKRSERFFQKVFRDDIYRFCLIEDEVELKVEEIKNNEEKENQLYLNMDKKLKFFGFDQ